MDPETTLEQRVATLEKSTAKLQRDHTATRRLVRDLTKRVDAILPDVKVALKAQTGELKVAIAESETRNADRITDVARQWPATAVVIATIAGGAVAAALVDLLLAAARLPHLS